MPPSSSEYQEFLRRAQKLLQSDPRMALENLERAEALAPKPLRYRIRLLSTRCLVQLGKMEDALALVQDMIDAKRKGPLHIHLEARHMKAAILQEMGRGRDALEESSRAAELAGKSRDTGVFADALCRLGELLRANGKVERARGIYSRALEQVPSRLPSLRAAILANLGNALLALGKPKRALETFDRVIELSGKNPKVRSGPSLAGKGNALQELGDFCGARRAYENAQHEFNAMGDRQTAAGIGLNLGHLLAQEGKLDEAASIFRRCLSSFSGPFSAQRRASAMGGLAEVATCSATREEAEMWYEKAAAEYSSCGDSQGKSYARLGVANMTLRAGHFEQAELRELLEGFRAMNHPPGQIATLELMAECSRERKAFAIAREQIAQALDISAGGTDPVHLSSLYAHLALLELEANRWDASREASRKGEHWLEKIPLIHVRVFLEIVIFRWKLRTGASVDPEQLDRLCRELRDSGHRFLGFRLAEARGEFLLSSGRRPEAETFLRKNEQEARQRGWELMADRLRRVLE